MDTSYYNTPNGIATVSISIAIAYNKDPDAEFIAIDHSDMDFIVEYFKDHAVYKYCTDLTMDGQLKFKGKPVIAYIGRTIGSNKGTKGSTSHDEIKKMINKLYGYGASKYTREAANV